MIMYSMKHLLYVCATEFTIYLRHVFQLQDIADPVLTDDERKMISQSFSVTTNVEPLSYIIPDDTLGEYN